MRYGFVGLGHLGKHLAANLARGGFEVGVFDLRSRRRRQRRLRLAVIG